MLARWTINGISLVIVAYLLEGIALEGAMAAVVAAVVLGVVNALIRPVLLILTLPLNMITLGLFTFVLNALLLYLTAAVVRGFDIISFGAALVGTILITIISMILSALIKK